MTPRSSISFITIFKTSKYTVTHAVGTSASSFHHSVSLLLPIDQEAKEQFASDSIFQSLTMRASHSLELFVSM